MARTTMRRRAIPDATCETDFAVDGIFRRKSWMELDGLVNAPLQYVQERTAARLLAYYDALIAHIAKHYLERTNLTPLDYDDLIQAGREGFLTSLKKYDPKTGFSPATYTYKFIKGSIIREIARLSQDIAPHYLNAIWTIRRAESRLHNLGLHPDLALLEAETGFSREKIEILTPSHE